MPTLTGSLSAGARPGGSCPGGRRLPGQGPGRWERGRRGDELRFAVTGDPGTQITAWASEVDQLSNGTLKITFVRDDHADQPDYEAAMIADVRAGTVDMAWVGARAFDQVGLTSFQPLVAPMLIDSLELRRQGVRRRHPAAAAAQRRARSTWSASASFPAPSARSSASENRSPRRPTSRRPDRRHSGLRRGRADLPHPRRDRQSPCRPAPS